MELRLLQPEDAPTYAELRRAMLADTPWAFASAPEDGISIELIAARLREPFNVIVGAFDEHGRLVGSCGLVRGRKVKMDHRAMIWGMYVEPVLRGQGVGERLLREAIGVARGWNGVTVVTISVSARSEAARRLYERVGFIAWGLEPNVLRWHGVMYDEVHLQLDLARESPSRAR